MDLRKEICPGQAFSWDVRIGEVLNIRNSRSRIRQTKNALDLDSALLFSFAISMDPGLDDLAKHKPR